MNCAATPHEEETPLATSGDGGAGSTESGGAGGSPGGGAGGSPGVSVGPAGAQTPPSAGLEVSANGNAANDLNPADPNDHLLPVRSDPFHPRENSLPPATAGEGIEMQPCSSSIGVPPPDQPVEPSAVEIPAGTSETVVSATPKSFPGVSYPTAGSPASVDAEPVESIPLLTAQSDLSALPPPSMLPTATKKTSTLTASETTATAIEPSQVPSQSKPSTSTPAKAIHERGIITSSAPSSSTQ